MSNLEVKIKRFGEKLSTLRNQRDLTLRQLGEILEVHHTHISQLEKNRKVPNAIMILKIAIFFDVSTDELMRDELDF